MSINNVYVIKKKGDTWYGWDETAERTMMDNPNRVLSFSKAQFKAPSAEEIMRVMNHSNMLSAEYGFVSDHLPKDGTLIKYVD